MPLKSANLHTRYDVAADRARSARFDTLLRKAAGLDSSQHERTGDHANRFSQTVKKVQPAEPAGVVCLVDGQADYVEYNELPAEAANMKQPNGDLVFNAASIIFNIFWLTFSNV